MTERVYMNQEDSKKQLIVKLFSEAEVDYLEFHLVDKSHKLNLNLEDNQIEIKRMFVDLIPLLKSNSIELVLEIEEGYTNTLLKEVSQSYINDLNGELNVVRMEILDEESDSDE